MNKAEKLYYDMKNGIGNFFKRIYYLLINQRKIPVGNNGGIWMFDAERGYRFFDSCTEKQYRKIMAMQHWENNPVYALTGGVLVDSDDINRANPLGVCTETEWSYMCNVTDEERERNLCEQKELFNFILNIFGNPNELGACVIPEKLFLRQKRRQVG